MCCVKGTFIQRCSVNVLENLMNGLVLINIGEIRITLSILLFDIGMTVNCCHVFLFYRNW